MKTQHTELAQFIREIATLEGSFQLASGRTSTYYIDGKLVTCDPHGLQLITRAIRAELAEFHVGAIGGLENGAIPIAVAVACDTAQTENPIPAFFVRKHVKSHGTKESIEGILPRPGGQVAIVDDVVTTGESIIKAINAVEAKGSSVTVAISIVDRLSGATEALAERNVPYRPLLTIKDLGLSNEQVSTGKLQKAAG